jgi:hypothetical protein
MRTLLLSFLLLGACQKIDDLKDQFEGYTATLAVEGLLLGVAPPESDAIDLSGTVFDTAADLSVFIGDASSLDDLGSAPIEGLSVSLKNDQLGSLPLVDEGRGLYTLSSANGLAYYDDQAYAITVALAGGTSRAPGEAPEAADVDVPLQHEAGTPLSIDVSAFDYDSVLIGIIDMSTSDVTYSNQPETIEEVYDFTHGTQAVARADIPGSAFTAESTYAVGVAGMRNADPNDFDAVNTLLSAFLLGKMRFWPLSTVAFAK